MFALDHTHYKRWHSVHVYDLKLLSRAHPDIYRKFSVNGGFVLSRTKNPFSAMGIDQCHEQLDKFVKGDGGALGLTEDEEKLRRWMVSGPEVAHLVKTFEEDSVLKSQKDSEYRHHEQTPAFQARFKKHVANLIEEFKKLRNPFEDDGNVELIQLDTKNVLSDAVLKAVNEVEELSYRQAKQFTRKDW